MNTIPIVRLEQLTSDDYHQFGSKAANLGELASMGLRIPSGIALGKEVLAQFLQEHRIDLEALARIHSLGMTFIESALYEASEIQKRIVTVLATASFPPEIDQTIFSALEQLSGGPFAVRSSCIVEDARLASFAGQYVTVLNVTHRAALLDAIRQCWLSQYAGRALTYALSRRGMPVLSPAMAIVIQRMIPSTYAGVCFTSGPTPKTRDYIVIESVSGSGEALVSGSATPCHFETSRDGRILSRILPSAPSPAEPPDSLIREIAAKSMAIANHFGSPQDIEWAVENDNLYFLQARPITVSTGRKKFISTNWQDQNEQIAGQHRLGQSIAAQSPWAQLRDQLHDLLISECDIQAFRAVCHLLRSQREDGAWRVEGKLEWNEVATAMIVDLLVNGGLPPSLKWLGPTEMAGPKEYGVPLALSWLASRTKPDGTWGSDLWDTCQVLRAFFRCGLTVENSIVKPGLAHVVNEIDRHLARASKQEWFGPGVLAVAIDLFAELEMREYWTQCVDLLLAYQSPDGDFYGPSLASSGIPVPSEWHTAQAVTALARDIVVSAPSVRTAIDKARQWLIHRQKIDGSWGVTYEPYCRYNTFFTAYAMIALHDAGTDHSESVLKARRWLRGMQLADGSYGDIASSLMAVSALQHCDGSVLVISVPIPLFLRIQHLLGANDK